MTDRAGTGLDPSVCYRHPNRQSWTLCDRCGRTICPDCRAVTAAGVRCPTCVAEQGAMITPLPLAGKRRGGSRRTRSPRPRSRTSLLDRDLDKPLVTYGLLGTAVALWVVGFVTAGAPFLLLAARPGEGTSWQLWRFVTNPVAYPSGFDFVTILGFALTAVFFFLSGPQAERVLGRRRYLLILGVASAVSAAAALLAGQVAYGLFGALFGVFGALLVTIWSDQRARTQFLVMMGVNLLIVIVVSRGYGLPALIGGLLAGVGTMALLQRQEERPLPKPWTTPVVLGGSTGVLVLLAVLVGG